MVCICSKLKTKISLYRSEYHRVNCVHVYNKMGQTLCLCVKISARKREKRRGREDRKGREKDTRILVVDLMLVKYLFC